MKSSLSNEEKTETQSDGRKCWLAAAAAFVRCAALQNIDDLATTLDYYGKQAEIDNGKKN